MGNIHHITLRTIAQATEDIDRVKAALSLFLFDGEIEAVTTEGHYGNPITLFQAQIKGKDCDRFRELLKSRLSEPELERLKSELGERIDDECYLHIRFDKQAAYKGVVQLAATTDTIAAGIKLKVYPARREKAIQTAEEIF
ncbi:RNA-binding protein [uncultured archaeon]|nr:RNA-binding protein [uncultured archaeon]